MTLPKAVILAGEEVLVHGAFMPNEEVVAAIYEAMNTAMMELPVSEATTTNKREDCVQLRNPRSDRWVKVNKRNGHIVSSKQSPGPYKNIREIDN